MRKLVRPVSLLMAGVLMYTSLSMEAKANTGLNVGMTAVMDQLQETASAEEAAEVVNQVLNPVTETYGYTNLGVANVQNHLNIRKEPSESAKLVGTMVKNSGCEVLETTEDGWAKIRSGKVEG